MWAQPIGVSSAAGCGPLSLATVCGSSVYPPTTGRLPPRRKYQTELHRIRYFIALSKTLNFTRAAEDCNVSQPALSRAISQLEGELGGDLFRRERSLTHMTEFGQTLLGELSKYYESSQNAKTIARAFLKGGHAPLNIALPHSVEMDILSPMLGELMKAFPRIEIRITRAPPHEIGEMLKGGGAEKKLEELGAHKVARHEVPTIDDLPGLVQSHFGVGIWPVARRIGNSLVISKVHGVEMSRWINLHTVFGRRLAAGAATLVGLLRSRDWPAAETARMEAVH